MKLNPLSTVILTRFLSSRNGEIFLLSGQSAKFESLRLFGFHKKVEKIMNDLAFNNVVIG